MEDVKLKGVCTVGGYCAYVAGVLFTIILFCALFSPKSVVTYIASEQYFLDFESYRPIFVYLKWLLLGANLALIGVVFCYFSLCRDENYGLMGFVSAVAIVGLGVGCYQSIQDATMIPYLADVYQQGSTQVRQIIIGLGVANPSLYILSMGLPGLWFIIVSFTARDNAKIPGYLLVLGVLWGVGNLLTVMAHVFVIVPLIRIVTLGAFVFAPAWSLLEGRFLLKYAKTLEPGNFESHSP
jgi:hypothetical protein